MKYNFSIFLFFLIIGTPLFCASKQQPMISGTPQIVIVEQEWLEDILSKSRVTDEQAKQVMATSQKKFMQLDQQVAAARNVEALRRASHQNEMQLAQLTRTNRLLAIALQ